MRKLDAIRKAGATVQEIILAPLAREDLGQLIADSLHCEPERAAPLAQLVHEKTAGNPFFAIQFISALAEEALLTFDHGDARWSWDLNGFMPRVTPTMWSTSWWGSCTACPSQPRTRLHSLPVWATAPSSPCWRWCTGDRTRRCTVTFGKRSERD